MLQPPAPRPHLQPPVASRELPAGRAREIVNGILKDDASIEYQNAVYAWGKGVEFAGAALCLMPRLARSANG